MTQLDVQAVRQRQQQRQFLELPWQLYRDDPHWIPPLRWQQAELVGYKSHPFHEHADVQTFLALRDAQPVGRVAAIVNHVHNERYQEQRGFFGFFECVDDPQVAGSLLEAAAKWLGEQGMTAIRGPVNPSMNYECGLLIEGFDSPPTFMMTYNPPYYPKLIEHCGFEKVQDMYAFWGHVDMLKQLDQKLDFVVTEAQRRFGVTLRKMNRLRFNRDVRLFLEIYNASLTGTWGFTPLSEGEIRRITRVLRLLIVPQMTSIAEVDGKPVGVVFGMPDYNPRIRAINGRLLPWGIFRLLWNRRAIKRIRVISTNVVPQYQRWGLGLVVLARLLPEALDWGIQEAEFSWVLESNHLSYASLKRGGADLIKTYRIYDRDLPG